MGSEFDFSPSGPIAGKAITYHLISKEQQRRSVKVLVFPATMPIAVLRESVLIRNGITFSNNRNPSSGAFVSRSQKPRLRLSCMSFLPFMLQASFVVSDGVERSLKPIIYGSRDLYFSP